MIVSGTALLFYFRRWFSEKVEGEGRRAEEGAAKGAGREKEVMAI